MIFALMLHVREESDVHCIDPRFLKIAKLIEELDPDEFDKDTKPKKEEPK